MEIGKTFGTDETKELNGIWYDIGEGASLLIARYGNAEFVNELTKARKPYRQQITRGTISEEDSRKILIGVMAKTILLGWKGVKENGKEAKYTQAKAADYLTKFKDFRDLVSTVSMDFANYQSEFTEAVRQD